MAAKVRVGVIGLGIGMGHATRYRECPQAELVAICDRDTAWLEHAQQSLHAPHAFTDYRDLLRSPDVDAVSICLPTVLHAQATIRALRAGKHVLCEKPMATNAKEAEAMAAAARTAGKVLMISQNQRFTPEAQYLKRRVEEGELGDIYFVRTGWRRPMGMFPSPVSRRATGIVDRNWFNQRAMGGGVLRDLGSHMLDLSLWLLGFPQVSEILSANYAMFTPDHAAAYGRRADAEDLAAGMIRFSNGASLQLEVSFGSFVESEVVFLELYGARGGAALRNGLRLFGGTNSAYTITVPQRFDMRVETPQAHFIRVIQEGSEPLVTAEQGVAVIRVLDALYASGILGQKEVCALRRAKARLPKRGSRRKSGARSQKRKR